MDTGSNKSLFTLIAVVIFGVFLSISYWMFQDELTGVLASVMDGTSEMINKKLDNSGRIPTDEKYFTYTVLNGEINITDYDPSGGKDVIIPTFINDLPVTTISNAAFYTMGLNSVILPEFLETVGDAINGGPGYVGEGVFEGNNLTEVIFPSSLTYIGKDAFSINKITFLDLPESLQTIKNNAFFGNKIASINLPSTLKVIEANTFTNNPTLKEIVIPNSMLSIGDTAFKGAGLTKVELPTATTYTATAFDATVVITRK
jgi:hypothetical protein